MKPILETVKCSRRAKRAGSKHYVYLELVGTWNPGNPAVVSVPTLDGTRPKALKGLRGGRVLGFEWNWLGIGWDSGKGQESRPASLPAEGKPHKSYCFSTSLSFKSAHENPGDGRKKCFRLWFHFTHPSSFLSASASSSGASRRTRFQLSCQAL